MIRLTWRNVLTICINLKHKALKMLWFLFAISIGVNIFTIEIFGHRDMNAVKAMQSGKLENDFRRIDCGIRNTCEVCTKCKLTRKPFPKNSVTKTGKVLELVYSDICGPMKHTTPSGRRYFLTLIDDYSRYIFVYLLSEKSEFFEKMKIYIEMVKNKFDIVPKYIRLNNGAEYKSKRMQTFLRNYGIRSQFSVPYNPEQNGIAEKKIRYLVKMSRCLLAEAGLSNIYWGVVIMCSNYLQNRLVTSSVPCTPYERWEVEKPDIYHLEFFRSKAYVLTPKVNTTKLDNKAEPLIFMGYNEQTRGLRFVNTNDNKIYISRDYKFVSMKIAMKPKEDQNLFSDNNLGINISPKRADNNDSDFDSFCSMSADFEYLEDSSVPDEPVARRSAGENKGVPPVKYSNLVESDDIIEPKTYIMSKQKLQWKAAMQE